MDDELFKIVIIGAGEIGQALGKVLSLKAEVRFWDRDEEKLRTLGLSTDALPEILPEADFAFFCVPSWNMREALVFAKPYLKKGAIVVSLAKGIDQKLQMTMDTLLIKVLTKNTPLAILGGALLAEELMAGSTGYGIIAANNKKVAQSLYDLFAETNLKINLGPDLRSLALAGVLKNIYALGFGLVTGLNWSDNERGLFLSRALGEMGKLQEMLGGKKNTVTNHYLAADFFATSLSSDSLNHMVGLALAQGKEIDKPSEGLVSLMPLAKMVGVKIKGLPILLALAQVLIRKEPLDLVFGSLAKSL